MVACGDGESVLFFYVSKVAWWIVQPSTVAIVLVVAGLVLLGLRRPWRRLGLLLGGLGAGLFLVAGFSPLANVLLHPLESRFEMMSASDVKGPLDGIIILGGFEDFGAGLEQPGLPVNHSAERLTEGLRLALLHKDARVVFTGALVARLDTSRSFGDKVDAFLRDIGLPADRVVIERAARNTYENAVNTKALVVPEPGETWVLVTSAFHMPRSVGVFRAVGFDVVPFPVDARTPPDGGHGLWFTSLASGMKRFEMVVREYLGLLAYWLTGRSSALFPEPESGPRR